MSSAISILAAAIIRSTEALGFRGGPTLLRLMANAGLGRTSTSTVTLPSGKRICFPTLDSYWAPYLWGRRRYEPDVEAIFRRLARIDDKLLVDCGANIGFWTVRLSDPEFGFTRFVAVEPNPDIVPLLTENARMNGIDCKVVAAAIAEEPGRIVYLANAELHAIASVADLGIPVQTTSLHELVSSEDVDGKVIVVKLDVEGSEIQALKGAQGLQTAKLVFIYEDWPRSLFPNTDFLLGSGYRILGVSPDGEVTPISSLEDARQFNTQTRTYYGPSNLVGFLPTVADELVPVFGEAARQRERI